MQLHTMVLMGVRVGGVDRPEAQRHSLSFDARSVRFVDPIVAVTMELPRLVRGRPCRLRVTDPHGLTYGETSTAAREVKLNDVAASDLEAAGGGYFYVELVVPPGGQMRCLAGEDEEHVILRAVVSLTPVGVE